MLPYLLLAISPVALSFGTDYLVSKHVIAENKARKTVLVLSGILIYLFMALRDPSIGSGDTLVYTDVMKRAVRAETWNQFYGSYDMEIGFQFFVFVLSRVFSSPQVLLVVTAAFFSYSICCFIYRNSDDVVLSLVMFITICGMTFYMQGMRQAIAMSIGLFAYECIKKRHYFRFCTLVTLASLFHQTALVLLLLLAIRFLKFNFKSFAFSTAFAAIFFLNLDRLISFANELFEKDYSGVFESGGGIATAIHFLILIFAFAFNRTARKNNNETMFLYVALAGALIYITRYFGVGIAERISFYYMFGQIALLPNTLQHFASRDRMLIKIAVFILCVSLSAYRLHGSNLVPYIPFWEG